MLASLLLAFGLAGPVVTGDSHDGSRRSAVVSDWLHDLSARRDRGEAALRLARLVAAEWPAAAESAYDLAARADPLCAEAYAGRGAARACRDRAGALADFDRAVDLAPGDAAAWEARGAAYGAAGDPARAAADFARAVALAPRPGAIVGLARARLELADHPGVESAAAVGLAVVACDAGRAELLGLRGESRSRRGDWAGALADAGRASQLCPADPRPRAACGDALARLGRPAEAAGEYRAALEVAPDFAPAAHRLAWLLATCPDPAVRDGGAAARLARQLADPVALAAALAESGDFVAAADNVRGVIPTAPEPAAEELRRQLAAYERRTPWRE